MTIGHDDATTGRETDPRHERALDALRALGRSPGEVLGVGMEGTVVDLPPDEIAKVWHERELNDLDRHVRFGHALESAALPFATSGAIELLTAGGTAVTIERKVPGEPLRVDTVRDPPMISDRDVQLLGDALAGLTGGTDPDLAVLSILPGEPAFDPRRPFGQELADLAQRRFDARPALLRAQVRDVDELVAHLLVRLRNLTDCPAALIHGDLIPANVLIEHDQVAGIVDFGFMSTLGDPAFDAAIAASVFDMYGLNARESERVLSEAFAARFGHDLVMYGLYRAAYAVITHAQFSVDGSDGHFAWCVALLERDDVRDAVFG